MSNLSWLKDRTILLVMAGSRSYGTNRPDSDVDVKGIAVTPSSYRNGFLNHFEQAEGKEHLKQFLPFLPNSSRGIAEAEGLDGAIFNLPKFFKLASECNPNIVEALFVDAEDVLFSTPWGSLLRKSRDLFLSKKAVHTFSGYAASQLARIETHRKWLLNPPEAPPIREDYGLPERTVIPADQLAVAQSQIKKQVDSWEIDFGALEEATKIYIQGQIQNHLTEISIGREEKYQSAARLLGYDSNFIELLERERHYRGALANWRSFQEWKEKRNPARAKMEAAFNYDGKHALHLRRLLLMCREILTEGTLRVRRPDAQDLMGMLRGEWSYAKLVTWAREQDKELHELAKTSVLPREPDRKRLDDLCQEITQAMPD